MSVAEPTCGVKIKKNQCSISKELQRRLIGLTILAVGLSLRRLVELIENERSSSGPPLEHSTREEIVGAREAHSLDGSSLGQVRVESWKEETEEMVSKVREG